MNKQEQLQKLQATGYIDQLEAWAKSCCAPVYYRDDKNVQHNGSMTFLNTGGALLGVTAGHVADSMRSFCDGSAGRQCQVGNAAFDRSWQIERHETLDLATFAISDGFLAAAGHYAAGVHAWPPNPVQPRDLVLLCGYPGMYRKNQNALFEVAFVWFAGLVESVSARNVGMALRIATSLTAGSERVPENADLGGWSGGAAFRLVEEALTNGLRARLEPAGIIYEYMAGAEIVLAHPLTKIGPTGHFTDY